MEITEKLDTAAIRALCDRCPFNRWLGLRIVESGAGWLVMELPWKNDLLSSPERQLIHGGVLASLIDTACGYAAAIAAGHAVPTTDLFVDYLRAADPGPLFARAEVVKLGRSLATVHARVEDTNGHLIATGRIAVMSSRVNNLPEKGAAAGA